MPDPSIKVLNDLSLVLMIEQIAQPRPANLDRALDGCDIYLKVLPVLPKIQEQLEGEGTARAEIHRIVKDDVEQQLYPPIHKRIVELPLDSLEIPSDDQKQLLDSWDMFYSLRKWDKVLLNDHDLMEMFFGETAANVRDDDLVMLLVKDIGRRTLEGLIEVQLRSVIDPDDGPRKSRHALFKLEKETTANGLRVPVKFMVRRADVRKATVQDELDCSRGQTVYDRLAIRYPAYFLAHVAGYNWETVREFYRNGDLTFNFGGMDAMLEYRGWLCEYALEHVADFAFLKSQIDRTVQGMDLAVGPVTAGQAPNADQALQDPVLTRVRSYVSGAKRMGWSIPGSSEATSDVDIATFNDGTEWAVRLFNSLFADLHNGTESGIAFDVNIYAGGFIPDEWDLFKVRQQGQKKKFLEPDALHRITDDGQSTTDGVNQEQAALLHLRRYLRDPRQNRRDPWKTYVDSVNQLARDAGRADDVLEFNQRAEVAEHAYWQNRYELADAIRRLVNQGPSGVDPSGASFRKYKLVVPRTDDYAQDLAAYDQLIEADELPRNVRLACENRLYESRLLTVARMKDLFNLRKDRANGRDGNLLDKLYVGLRLAMSDSLYFGNECYASEGSLLQVVGGKQIISSGVGADKKGGLTFHNIRYSPHQLLQSMHEQLGDFFKESNRHFEHATTVEGKSGPVSYGESVIAGGKYLHRYFNALKWFYLIQDGLYDEMSELRLILREPTPEFFDVDAVFDNMGGGPRHGWPGFLRPVGEINRIAPPHGITVGPYDDSGQAFKAFRRAFGFGLEKLKKFDLDKDRDAPNLLPIPAIDPGNDNPDLDLAPAPVLTSDLALLAYKLGVSADVLKETTNDDKWMIALTVVLNYLRYVHFEGASADDYAKDLTGFQAALVKIHAFVTVDAYCSDW